MVSNDQPLSALQLPQDRLRIRTAVEQVSQNEHRVIAGDPLIPGSDQCPVHIFYAAKGPLTQLQDVFMPKMGVCYIVIHVTSS